MRVPDHRLSSFKWLLGREILAAFLVVIGLVGITTTVRQIPFAYLPGYLIIRGSDLLQNPLLPNVTGWTYMLFFVLYLYGIAVIVGHLYRWIRPQLTHLW